MGSSAKIQQYHFAETATFATALPALGDTWTHIPALEGAAFSPVQAFDQAQEGDTDGLPTPQVATVKSASGTMSARIYNGPATDGFGGALAAPASFYLQKLIENYFNATAGSFAGTTVGAASGAGASASVVVASSTGADVGGAVLFAGASGTPECRFITEVVDGTHVKLDRNLATAANYANAAVAYGSWSISPVLGEVTKQIHIHEKKDAYRYQYGSGIISALELGNFTAQAPLTWNLTHMADSFAQSGADVTTHTDNSTTFTGPPLITKGAILSLNGVEYCASAFTFNPGISKQEQLCAYGTNGRSGWSNVEVMGKGSVTLYYSDTLQDLAEANTPVPLTLFITNGSTGAAMAAGALALYCPRVQFDMPDKNAVINGMNAMTLNFTCLGPTVAQQATGITKSMYLSIFGGKA